MDCDGDLGDHAVLLGCLTGPVSGPPATGCDTCYSSNADLGADGDAGTGDFAELILKFTGRQAILDLRTLCAPEARAGSFRVVGDPNRTRPGHLTVGLKNAQVVVVAPVKYRAILEAEGRGP